MARTTKKTNGKKMTNTEKKEKAPKIGQAELDRAPTMMLPLTTIRQDPQFNVRQATIVDEETGEMVYDEPKKAAAFAAQIKAEGGLLQAVIVRERKPEDKQGTIGYDLVVGFRRFRAMNTLAENDKKGKFQTIPAKILPADTPDDVIHTMNMVENIQREDLRPFEKADKYHMLQQTYGFSGRELGRRFGESGTHINNLLRIVKKGNPKLVTIWRACSGELGTDVFAKKIIKTDDTTHEEQWENWLRYTNKMPSDALDSEDDGDSKGSNGVSTEDKPKRASRKAIDEALERAMKLDSENADAYFEGVIAALAWVRGDTESLARVYDPEAIKAEKEKLKAEKKAAEKAAAAQAQA